MKVVIPQQLLRPKLKQKSKKTKSATLKSKATKNLGIPKHLRRLFSIYLACIIGSSIAAVVLASSHHTAPLPDPFNAEQRTRVPFTLYYPTKLPAPYYVDIASLGRLEDSVVVMRITDGSGEGHAFSISQQALPKTINLDALYESFGERHSFPSPLGKATAGTIDNGSSRIVSLVTEDKTWILVQAPASVSPSVIQDSLQSLEPSR
jgi:hypothetical protein